MMTKKEYARFKEMLDEKRCKENLEESFLEFEKERESILKPNINSNFVLDLLGIIVEASDKKSKRQIIREIQSVIKEIKHREK